MTTAFNGIKNEDLSIILTKSLPDIQSVSPLQFSSCLVSLCYDFYLTRVCFLQALMLVSHVRDRSVDYTSTLSNLRSEVEAVCQEVMDLRRVLGSMDASIASKDEEINTLHSAIELKQQEVIELTLKITQMEGKLVDQLQQSELSDIANEFFALGEKLVESVLVRKIVRVLPDRFDTKLLAMEEAKDFGKMKVEEHMGLLRTLELNQQIKQKDVSDDEKDDEMALLTINFQKLMKKGIQCRECEGYVQSECANTLKKNKKGFKVTWSDDDSESSEADNEKVALTNVLSSAFQERGKILCLNNTLTDVDKKEIDSDSDESKLMESLAESYKEVQNSSQLSHAGLGFVETQSKMNTKFVKSENMSSGYSDSTLQGFVFTAERFVSTEMKQSGKPENSHWKKKRYSLLSFLWGKSGCSKHMTGDKDFLVNIRLMQCGEVTFGNGLAGNVIGMGTLNFEGLPRLKNVMLVEGLRANLLSVSQICDQGYTVNFDSNRCYVVNDQD
ncbi:uncharacterized protein LOC133785626 [Humulus lupulus]|uniref:uncharacterized protein LOC133785626 n=1 Tax=Humulus lupulus TaxID=3486 RepID=UPI002B412DF3|nr:uncharacterized protein LOC133785626 [Humulus lupulus]